MAKSVGARALLRLFCTVAGVGAHSHSAITVRNTCPFAVKVVDGAGDSWQTTLVRPGAEHSYEPTCQSACASYFVPATWNGKPGKYSMGGLRRLGFLEYTKVHDGTLSTDLSYILGLGMPMTAQCAGGPKYGCTDGGYGGWQDFQERLRKYCPGKYEKFEGTDMSYCMSGAEYMGGVESMPFGKKWCVNGTFARAGVTMPQANAQSLAECQPWTATTAQSCAQVARGAKGCVSETVCHGESRFYRGYDMREVHSQQAWHFNGYAAFVHTLCGVYSGFAFASDDQGVGSERDVRLKYASNVGTGCRGLVVELCPAASPGFEASGGYTYPPARPSCGPIFS